MMTFKNNNDESFDYKITPDSAVVPPGLSSPKTYWKNTELNLDETLLMRNCSMLL